MTQHMKTTVIPQLDLAAQHASIRDEIQAAVARVIDSGHYILGPEVAAFEAEFAAWSGTQHAVAVSTGTAALHLALRAAGIGPGDEVITSPFTFVASAAAILYAGARPVFADINPRTYAIDVALARTAITKSTRAIMPVHLYGHPADMDAIMTLAAEHRLTVVEDAAQAHGALVGARHAGSFGAFGCFSFYPTKNLGACGEGGLIVTGDAGHARTLRMLREDAENGELRSALKRPLHTLKGGARMAGLTPMGDLSHELETLVLQIDSGTIPATSAFDSAISLLEQNYPESPMLLAARARKAAFLSRRGQQAEARTLFASVVDQAASVPDAGTALLNLLAPYFELLARDGSEAAAAEMFRASQEIQRPGVARTQAVFARQMSEGSDAAADMFRLAVARTRDVARTEAEVATLSAKVSPTPRDIEDLAAAKSSLEALRADQVKLQSQLADYPRYKVLAPTRTELSELRGALRGGEGYYKLMVVGDRVYAIYATNGGARAMRLASTRGMLTDEVSAIRRSIVENVNGETSIGAFDVDRSRKLYRELFGLVDADVQALKHLVFEPDGPMLQLPPYLLIARDEGLSRIQGPACGAGRRPVRHARHRLARQGPQRVHFGQPAQLPRRSGAGSIARPPGLPRPRQQRAGGRQAGRRGGRRVRLAGADVAGADFTGRTDGRAGGIRRGQGGGTYRRCVQRHRPAWQPATRRLPDPPLCHPRAGHRAATGLPGTARTGHVIRRPRLRRTVEL